MGVDPLTLKRLRLFVLAIVLLAAIAVPWWLAGPRYVPEGQPPLATLDAAALAGLREEFNRAAQTTRVIVLLSPT